MEIALAESDPLLATFLSERLAVLGHVVDSFHAGQTLMLSLLDRPYHLLILSTLEDFSAFQIFCMVRAAKPTLPALLMLESGDKPDFFGYPENALTHFLMRPFHLSRLESVIECIENANTNYH